MNSFSTDYTPRTKALVTPFSGGSIPIYEKPTIEIEGEGTKDVSKARGKQDSRLVKSTIVREVKGQAVAAAKKEIESK